MIWWSSLAFLLELGKLDSKADRHHSLEWPPASEGLNNYIAKTLAMLAALPISRGFLRGGWQPWMAMLATLEVPVGNLGELLGGET